MNAKLIDALGHRYYKLSLWIIAGITLLMLLLLGGSPYWSNSTLNAILISVAFCFLTSIAYGEAWKAIAKKSPGKLTTFYLAAPALRMVAAVLLIIVYYIVNRTATAFDGTPAIRGMMITFIFIFAVYYIALFVLDCVYFAKVEKRNKLQ